MDKNINNSLLTLKNNPIKPQNIKLPKIGFQSFIKYKLKKTSEKENMNFLSEIKIKPTIDALKLALIKDTLDEDKTFLKNFEQLKSEEKNIHKIGLKKIKILPKLNINKKIMIIKKIYPKEFCPTKFLNNLKVLKNTNGTTNFNNFYKENNSEMKTNNDLDLIREHSQIYSVLNKKYHIKFKLYNNYSRTNNLAFTRQKSFLETDKKSNLKYFALLNSSRKKKNYYSKLL